MKKREKTESSTGKYLSLFNTLMSMFPAVSSERMMIKYWWMTTAIFPLCVSLVLPLVYYSFTFKNMARKFCGKTSCFVFLFDGNQFVSFLAHTPSFTCPQFLLNCASLLIFENGRCFSIFFPSLHVHYLRFHSSNHLSMLYPLTFFLCSTMPSEKEFSIAAKKEREREGGERERRKQLESK